jgi:hypothetical protein
MVNVNGFWTKFLTDAGNEPGANEGDVTIHLISPVEGVQQFNCPSREVTLAAEMGQFIGLQVQLPDGRRLFVPAVNVSGIIDTPKDAPPQAKTGRSRAGGASQRLIRGSYA